MLPVLVSFVLGSVWFPSSLQFSTLWKSKQRSPQWFGGTLHGQVLGKLHSRKDRAWLDWSLVARLGTSAIRPDYACKQFFWADLAHNQGAAPTRVCGCQMVWFNMFFLFQKLPLGHGTCERMRACLPEASTVGEKQRCSTIDDWDWTNSCFLNYPAVKWGNGRTVEGWTCDLPRTWWILRCKTCFWNFFRQWEMESMKWWQSGLGVACSRPSQIFHQQQWDREWMQQKNTTESLECIRLECMKLFFSGNVIWQQQWLLICTDETQWKKWDIWSANSKSQGGARMICISLRKDDIGTNRDESVTVSITCTWKSFGFIWGPLGLKKNGSPLRRNKLPLWVTIVAWSQAPALQYAQCKEKWIFKNPTRMLLQIARFVRSFFCDCARAKSHLHHTVVVHISIYNVICVCIFPRFVFECSARMTSPMVGWLVLLILKNAFYNLHICLGQCFLVCPDQWTPSLKNIRHMHISHDVDFATKYQNWNACQNMFLFIRVTRA